jgi:hypothetical protein
VRGDRFSVSIKKRAVMNRTFLLADDSAIRTGGHRLSEGRRLLWLPRNESSRFPFM